MKSSLSDFELVSARTLPLALQLLASEEGWRPIAGGTDLMVLLNAGLLPAKRLVSVRLIEDLREIAVTSPHVVIGAAVTYTQIRQHPVLQAEFPLLCQAAGWTGGVANQNQGTLGGNIANGSPAADSTPPLLVHDAQILLTSTQGTRCVPYRDFHLGYKRFDMRVDELIVGVQLPRSEMNWRYYGRKVGTRKAQAISKVSFAAAARVENGHLAQVRLAFGSVAPVPLRCRTTENALQSSLLNSRTIALARKTLESEIQPITDVRSTAVYRSQVAQNLLSAFLESLR